MPSSTPIVCLLSDFGLSDHFIGIMKGILITGDPDTQIVDISHDIPPQNIRYGAFQIMETYKFFPERAIFICIVDPGVGTGRKIICAESANRIFVGPDNGLLSWVFNESKPTRVFQLDLKKITGDEPSATFHGRDIMAPFVVKLLRGAKISEFGTLTTEWFKLPFPAVAKAGSRWIAEVVLIDHFGNLVTNIKAAEIKNFSDNSKIWFELGDKNTIRGISKNYSSVPEGRPLVVVGSSGFLEISVRNGNAGDFFKMKSGNKLHVHFRT